MNVNHHVAEQPAAQDELTPQHLHQERMRYVVGAGLSVLLTVISFAAYLMGLASAGWVIVIAGLIQIVVQLHFFLHIGFVRERREDLYLILFSILLLTLLAGGTIWVMNNLAYRMM